LKGSAMSYLKTRAMVTVLAILVTVSAASAGNVYLGITMETISNSMATALGLDEGQGVLLNEVVDGSPADDAGLRQGDVIIAIDGHQVKGISGLSKALHHFEPDDEVTITVMREGRERELNAVLGEKKKSKTSFSWTSNDDDSDESHNVWRWENEDGEQKFVIESIGSSALDRGFMGIVPEDVDDDEPRGVRIGSLVDDGAAEEAGLREGDVIIALGVEKIRDREELHDYLEDTDPGDELEVTIIRNGRTMDYTVELGKMSGAAQLATGMRIFTSGRHEAPDFYEFHMPEIELRSLEEESEEIEEMKEQLQELKEELEEMREELNKRK